MTTTPEQTFVDYEIVHPAEMTDEQRVDFLAAIVAGLRHVAREQGRSLPEEVEQADIQRVGYESMVFETDEGPVEARRSTYRARTVEMPTLDTAVVQAVEQEDGIWIADLPESGRVYGVKHGLNSLDVQARGLRGDRTPGALRHFIPIDVDEVEVIGLGGTEHVIIEPVPDDPGLEA